MKDFSKLNEYLKKNREIKTKDAIALGYSNYDLKVFLDSSLLEKTGRGIYQLPSITKEKTSSEDQSSYIDVKRLNYEAIGHIFKKEYDLALEKYMSLASYLPQNSYYDFAISYLYFLKEDYQTSLNYLLSSIDKQDEKHNFAIPYLILQLMTKYVDIDPSIIAKTSLAKKDNININFFNKVYKLVENGDYLHAQKNLFYFIRGDARAHQFRLGNQYLYAVLVDIIDKLGLELLGKKKEENGYNASTQVLVPEVNPKQILTNSILLQALDDNDFEKALRQVDEYEITDSKSLIISLINRLRECKERGIEYLSQPTKVVSEEPVEIFTAPIPEELPELINISKSPEEPSLTPELQSEISSPLVAPAQPEPEPKTVSDYYDIYKEAMSCCDFTSAKKALYKYDTLLKQSSNYRNLSYHYARISNAEKEYLSNPEAYQAKTSLINNIYSLMIRKQYDEALEELNAMPSCQEKYLLSAQINQSLGNDAAAIASLKLVSPSCQEPNYFRVSAELSFASLQYQECLEYCIKYNECRPKQTANIYILMANCYEKLHKPSKAAKALRIANEILQENGINKDLSSRINHNNQIAEKQRLKRLAAQNKQDYDE